MKNKPDWIDYGVYVFYMVILVALSALLVLLLMTTFKAYHEGLSDRFFTLLFADVMLTYLTFVVGWCLKHWRSDVIKSTVEHTAHH